MFFVGLLDQPHPAETPQIVDSTPPLHMERGGRNFYFQKNDGVRLIVTSTILP
jgi:hypothetical protein